MSPPPALTAEIVVDTSLEPRALAPALPRRKTKVVARPRHSGLSSLAPLLVLTFVAIAAGLECHLQLTVPSQSALAWLHGQGLFTGVAIGYEPGRGIGRMLGITGASMMTLMLGYSIRKRASGLRSLGRLSRWLDVHIALGLVGPALVTLHTAGRLGGIISVAYWSMVIVVASGVVGRYLYAQVPRTISGRERSLEEVAADLVELRSPGLGLAPRDVCHRERRALELERQIRRLEVTRRLLALWHRLHIPLVCVLYGIMVLHIAVAMLFDSR